MDKHTEPDTLEARRRFLAKCGKFAVITPPAMTLLLSSTAQNYAVAASGGGGTHLPGSGQQSIASSRQQGGRRGALRHTGLPSSREFARLERSAAQRLHPAPPHCMPSNRPSVAAGPFFCRY